MTPPLRNIAGNSKKKLTASFSPTTEIADPQKAVNLVCLFLLFHADRV